MVKKDVNVQDENETTNHNGMFNKTLPDELEEKLYKTCNLGNTPSLAAGGNKAWQRVSR